MKDDTNRNEPEVEIEPTGEDTVDDPLVEEIEATSQNKIKDLQVKLKASEAERKQHLDELQRAKADFLNAKRRLEEEKLRDTERVTEKYIQKILPLCDSFAMAMSDQEAWEAIDENWRTGVESINNQLKKVLLDFNVSEINPLGEEFDPNQHEAMTEVPVAEKDKDHTIISVIQNGFVREINGETKIIRPARVAVGIFQE